MTYETMFLYDVVDDCMCDKRTYSLKKQHDFN